MDLTSNDARSHFFRLFCNMLFKKIILLLNNRPYLTNTFPFFRLELLSPEQHYLFIKSNRDKEGWHSLSNVYRYHFQEWDLDQNINDHLTMTCSAQNERKHCGRSFVLEQQTRPLEFDQNRST